MKITKIIILSGDM